MELGMIGLGRMGSNITRRLIRAGHRVVVYDVDATAAVRLEHEGAQAASSTAELVTHLKPPRAVWIMVPAHVTGQVIDDVASHLEPGDIIIDGGNTFYQDDFQRAAMLAKSGIDFVDVGTSGGIFGLDRGYCLMIGGSDTAVARLEPVFRSLAPGVDAAERTDPDRGEPVPAEHGYVHCGPTGAGHFVKMVHNGIEYGIMAAYAEGLNVMRGVDAGPPAAGEDPDIAAFRRGLFEHGFDVASIAEVWRRGSVISSWLLDLTTTAISRDGSLSQYAGVVADSGEGRWAVQTAVDQGVPVPVMTAALFGRFSTRGNDDFANRLLSAMRQQFGGHGEASPSIRRGT